MLAHLAAHRPSRRGAWTLRHRCPTGGWAGSELAAAGPGSTMQGIQHRGKSPSSKRTEHTTGISSDALSDVRLSRQVL